MQEPPAKRRKLEEEVKGNKVAGAPVERTVCPYLDTIDRRLLDFDFEKLCSVSLSKVNVYACLVCGKYFQGRGKTSFAYFHALENSHHVFINLDTRKIYCLPDNYEVVDASLEDIRYNLHPSFTRADLGRILNNDQYLHALDGTDYLPGVLGLNSIQGTDWFNSVLQPLFRVPTLTSFFVLNECKRAPAVVRHTAQLFRKVWNFRRFTSHVSPHELLQSVSEASQKVFRIGAKEDAFRFMRWFLNVLHRGLRSSRSKTSVVSKSFQGEILETRSHPELSAEQHAKFRAWEGLTDEQRKKDLEREAVAGTTQRTRHKFLILSLDLPPAPLFKDTSERGFIPQESVFALLERFNGKKVELMPDGSTRTQQLSRLPPFLIMHFKRFTNNTWFTEKNPTIVNSPLRALDLSAYFVKPSIPLLVAEDLNRKRVAELNELARQLKVDTRHVEKATLVAALLRAAERRHARLSACKYDMIANIVHEGDPKKGDFRTYVLHEPSNTWFCLQDLDVTTTETMAQTVAQAESYIHIYRLRVDPVERVERMES